MNDVNIASINFVNYNIVEMLNAYKLSSKVIKSILDQGKIKVNGINVSGSYAIQKEDTIVFSDKEIDMIPYNFKVDILFQNDYLIAVNKPRNILVHSDGNTYETLQNAVYNYLLKTKHIKFCQAVHRLDYETTGIVIFAKNSLALSFLSFEFERQLIKKEYAALINGKINPSNGEINKPISKDRHSLKQVVTKSGKKAKTVYKTIYYKDNISKLKILIIGGRKHQIRVHLSSVGHPIIGDKIYSQDLENSLKLHACHIELIDPQTFKTLKIDSKEEF